MTTGNERATGRERTPGDARLAQLCSQLADSTSPFREGTLRTAAVRVAAAVRDGADPTRALEELDEALLRAGHAAGLGSSRGYEPLPPLGAGHRVLDALVCPSGGCPRVALPPAPDRPLPTCAIWQRPLRRERIT